MLIESPVQTAATTLIDPDPCATGGSPASAPHSNGHRNGHAPHTAPRPPAPPTEPAAQARATEPDAQARVTEPDAQARAPAPSPAPDHPHHPSPPAPPLSDLPFAPLPSAIPAPTLSPQQLNLLLRFFTEANQSLVDIAEHFEIDVLELEAWAASPWAQARFEAIRRLSALRDELIQAQAVPEARQTLFYLATLSNPTERASSRESRRKAAMAIVSPRAAARVPRSSGADHGVPRSSGADQGVPRSSGAALSPTPPPRLDHPAAQHAPQRPDNPDPIPAVTHSPPHPLTPSPAHERRPPRTAAASGDAR